MPILVQTYLGIRIDEIMLFPRIAFQVVEVICDMVLCVQLAQVDAVLTLTGVRAGVLWDKQGIRLRGQDRHTATARQGQWRSGQERRNAQASM